MSEVVVGEQGQDRGVTRGAVDPDGGSDDDAHLTLCLLLSRPTGHAW